ncbi:MAG: paaJ [Alphaproteobacteria bacterium]|nr:paaJ [Alphaproteobacteria bacterium]
MVGAGHANAAPPLDGEGLGRGELSACAAVFTQSTPTQPSLIEGEGSMPIWQVLSDVEDPEIPVISVVDLGIVREVDTARRRVVITPTYTGCPATRVIEQDIRAALDSAGYRDWTIATALSPAWTTDWISADGRRKLLAYGIAPPVPAGERAVHCPQCGSGATEEISRFGSTPCKALWRCRDCAEPFDLFKCH